MPMQQAAYDICVHYHSHNQQWVDGYLLPHLDAAGFQVAIDHRILTFSEPYWVSMQRAVGMSRHILVVVSPEWLAESWAELQLTIRKLPDTDPETIIGRITPVLLQPADLPPPLCSRPSFDFADNTDIPDNTQGEQWQATMRRLLVAMSPPMQQKSPTATSHQQQPSSGTLRMVKYAARRLLKKD